MSSQLLSDLDQALEHCLEDDLDEIMLELIERPAKLLRSERASVLELLCRHGRYEPAIRFAEVCPRNEWAVIKRGSQAMVERGQLTRALEWLAGYSASTPSEQDEVEGRRGRIYKQFYIDAQPTPHEPRTADWEQAFRHYAQPFGGSVDSERWKEPGAPYWHGVNCLALLHHAAGLAADDDARRVELLRRRDALAPVVYAAAHRAHQGDPTDVWALLTLAETCLADSARHADAVEYCEAAIQRIRTHSDVKVFEVLAFERQLTRLWGVTAEDPIGRNILLALQEVRARSGGGAWPVHTPSRRGLGAEAAVRYDVVARLFRRARGTARIERCLGQIAVGSAFAVSRNLLLSCRHVVGPVRPGALEAVFTENRDGSGQPRRIPISRVVWTGRPHGMHLFDATLLELQRPLPSADDVLPLTLDHLAPAEVSRVYALGYPGGADLHVSLHDSAVLDWNDHVIQYRTSTEPGSSGCALLDEHWNVIGIHTSGGHLPHARTGKLVRTNQGVRMDQVWPRIQHEVRRSWRAFGNPTDLRSECKEPAVATDSVAADEASVLGSPPSAPAEDSRAMWRQFDSAEALDRVIAGWFARQSAWPAVEYDKRIFEFTFDLVGPRLFYKIGGVERMMSNFGDTIINHTDPPGAVPGEEPFFFLHIRGRAYGARDQELSLRGHYRQGDECFSFGPSQLGKDVVIAIPSTMSDRAPVQFFTFEVTALPAQGREQTYDPLCVHVPIASPSQPCIAG
ncbi:MAG: serine protease [Myxococcota bacterium]